MSKIIVTQDLDLFPDQLERLHTLGEVAVYNDLAESYDAWLERVQGFDVICTGKFGSYPRAPASRLFERTIM
ncbi:MAG TPA: hypothetical protein VF733_05230 [Candidatus Saccharimonadales bacterium]